MLGKTYVEMCQSCGMEDEVEYDPLQEWINVGPCPRCRKVRHWVLYECKRGRRKVVNQLLPDTPPNAGHATKAAPHGPPSPIKQPKRRRRSPSPPTTAKRKRREPNNMHPTPTKSDHPPPPPKPAKRPSEVAELKKEKERLERELQRRNKTKQDADRIATEAKKEVDKLKDEMSRLEQANELLRVERDAAIQASEVALQGLRNAVIEESKKAVPSPAKPRPPKAVATKSRPSPGKQKKQPPRGQNETVPDSEPERPPLDKKIKLPDILEYYTLEELRVFAISSGFHPDCTSKRFNSLAHDIFLYLTKGYKPSPRAAYPREPSPKEVPKKKKTMRKQSRGSKSDASKEGEESHDSHADDAPATQNAKLSGEASGKPAEKSDEAPSRRDDDERRDKDEVEFTPLEEVVL